MAGLPEPRNGLKDVIVTEYDVYSSAEYGPNPATSKKSRGFLKGLARLLSLVPMTADSDGDACQRGSSSLAATPLAHAISTPDLSAAATPRASSSHLPAWVPVLGSSPSTSGPIAYPDAQPCQRLNVGLNEASRSARSGSDGSGLASPPDQPHSPCSPFPFCAAERAPAQSTSSPAPSTHSPVLNSSWISPPQQAGGDAPLAPPPPPPHMAACGPSGHPAAAGCCNTSPSTQRQQPQQVHVHLRGEVAGAGLSRTVSDGAALAAAASSAALLPPPPPSQQQQQHQQVCVPHHMHLQQQPGVASRPLMPQPRAASAAAAAPLMTTMMMMGASPAPHAVGGFTLGTAVMAAANSSNGGSCGAGGGGGGGGGVERRPLQDNSPHMAAVASVPSRVGSGVPMPGSPYHTAAGGIPVACNNSYPAPPAPAPQHHAPPVAAVIITPPMALPVLSAPSPPAPVPATTLLAINPAVPASMRRHVWSLDDYNVAKRLYKSASSSVYKATCMHSGLPVALKVYFLAKVPLNVVHMIKREIELHVQLVHPHVIQLYGAFLDGDRIVLVQEYAARGDLLHLLRAVGGRMTEAQVSELVLAPFLQGVAYLHGRGVCHRDIKPENILFTADWALKIADLGVSINMNEERAVTRAGTMDYMAPEVCRCPLKAEPDENKDNDALAYTAAVDVWAAGVLAYELLVGFTPMVVPAAVQQAGHSFLTAQQATTASLHFPSSLSAAGRDFICGALSESPGDRPTARELLRHPWLLSAVRGGAAAAVGSATAVLGGAAAVGAAAGSLEASMPAATATAAVAAATAVGMESMSF